MESINTDIEDDSWLINTRTGYNHDLGFPNLCDSLELTNVEDEGEQIGGAKNCQLTRLSQQLELKTYFNQWRDLADLAAKQRRKAEFYYRFTTLEKSFKNWKVFNKQEKDKRARKKWIKAVAFDEHRLMR